MQTELTLMIHLRMPSPASYTDMPYLKQPFPEKKEKQQQQQKAKQIQAKQMLFPFCSAGVLI